MELSSLRIFKELTPESSDAAGRPGGDQGQYAGETGNHKDIKDCLV
jgi:hypothetical protein